MKSIKATIVASLISIACLTVGFSKENPNEFKDANPKESAKPTQTSNLAMQQISRASKIMGTAVKNPSGDKLGEITDLVLNPDNGQVVYAVVSFGGMMGMGDKLFAIPWRALHWKADSEYYVLQIDRSTLKTAPGFDKNHWPDSSDSWDLQREGLNQFYGVSP
ncbi:PRC-barrel domain-containing protein [Methylomonas koyamae]|uniref:PRC-barrel domain-containing protein n=1 Tax=Methylomonas koyamae TaxID=702114 RepID=UPI000BC2ED94|nr:PRC-barrel domain-containing protein [Methylomonas koyamae]ATG90132.1 PRC-barrel domain protein [Methylomonas koyamae]